MRSAHRIVCKSNGQDCGRLQICGRIQEHVKSTNVFMISKWKRFGTTNSLSRSGCPNKLSNQGQRAFGRQVTKNPAVIQRSFVEMGEPYSPALHQSDIMIEWPDLSCSSLRDSHIEFARKVGKLCESLGDLNPMEHLWRDLKMAVHQCSPTNLVKFE